MPGISGMALLLSRRWSLSGQ
ncbi:hypothetical protein [Nitrosospira sp. NpAV]